jgi:hypothetical protein
VLIIVSSISNKSAKTACDHHAGDHKRIREFSGEAIRVKSGKSHERAARRGGQAAKRSHEKKRGDYLSVKSAPSAVNLF